MARGQLNILRSFDEVLGKRRVSFVVKNFASSSHSKPKSIKNCGKDISTARSLVSSFKNNKNLVITREFRRVKK